MPPMIRRYSILLNWVISIRVGIWFGCAVTTRLMHILFPVICVPCLYDGFVSRNSRRAAACWRCRQPLAQWGVSHP